jgi:hypothetical protein
MSERKRGCVAEVEKRRGYANEAEEEEKKKKKKGVGDK